MPGYFNIETVLRPGQIVAAQYRVDRLVDKGGMAAVWAGVNQHTGKRVALKVILHSFADNREVIELFRREALSASKVNHPNVVNIFDVIDHEGMTCIVMELLDGETLGSYLARNEALSLERTLALLLPAMHGVAAANAQGVVHRDLKPGNIFLCCSSEGRLITTKVLDFGISVMMGRVGDAGPATELFAMFGTPAYMAPEAIEFSPTIDGRADVYGFGMLFFEALTGKLPFIGPLGPDLLRRILTEAAPRVTLYRSDLPSDVADLVACALAKDPNDRFPDMALFVRATEDRLLPLLPALSSPTQISDIRLSPPTEWNPLAPVPVVGATSDEGPGGRVNRGETRALYSVEGGVLRRAIGAAIASRGKHPSMSADARTGRKRAAALHSRSLLYRHRRGAIGVAMVIVVVGAVWVSFPSPWNDRERRSLDNPDTAAPAPMLITKMPPSGPPISAPSPTAAAETVDALPPATVPSLRLAAPHPPRRASRAKSTTRKPRASQAPPPASRPGKLTASDF